MTLMKLGYTGKWKRNCCMAISVEYAVEETMDLSQVRLRYDDNNQATGWKAEKK